MDDNLGKIPLVESSAGLPDQESLDWAFPDVSPGIRPFGGRIVVQLRRVKKRAGRIILVEETRDQEKYQGQIGKIISVGPLAFKNKDTMAPWTEGDWAKIGDFVRVIKWGGDRWEKSMGKDEEPVLFLMLNDNELIGAITDDPLSYKVFV